jgi:hypothetical protein
LISGCGPDEPCPGVVQGATYEVELHEQTKRDPDECHLGWGLEPGFTFLATVNETQFGGTCLAGRPDLSGAQDWSFERQEGDTLYDGLFESAYKAQFRDCQSYVSLSVASSTGLPCIVDDDASSAECELDVGLEVRAGTGCPVNCWTSLAVTVTRL